MEKISIDSGCKKNSLESDFFLEGQEAELQRSKIFKKSSDNERMRDWEIEKK